MSIADVAQRQQALDVSSSYIVQAPAGSGKTGVLTLRILTLLTVVAKPEDILAITFTKKAAAEMRLRVMEALALAASGREPESDYERQFYQLGCAVLKRDREKNWGLQSNQNRLHLQTIDSFCSGVVRNRPLSSGLGVQFNVAEDPSELYSEATRELLQSLDDDDELGRALRTVLGFLNNQYQKFEAMLSQMLAQRDHWLKDISELHANGDQLRALLEQSLYNINEAACHRFFALFGEDFAEELHALTTYARNQLELSGMAHGLLVETETEIQAIKQQLALFVTKSKLPSLRARFDKRDGFPAGSGTEKKVAKEYKDRAKSFVQQIENGGETALERLIELLNLPAERLDDQSWQLLQDLMLIVRYGAAHLKLVFQQQQQVDFSEIALAALSTLGEADAPNDVALMLDATINHILIDEFQDTSFIQIELLERLTAGWQEGDGRSLFLVGDPMQSIYAFRQADVGLFVRLWEQRALGSIPLTPLLLSTNFRSSEAIINWINASFRWCFPARSNQRKGAVTYAPSVAAKPSSPRDGVSVDLFKVVSELDSATAAKQIQAGIRAEAEWIVARIAEVPQEHTIAVLVKGKSHVLQIAALLRQRGIVYQAVEIESLHDSQVVSDLMAVARAVWSPNDKTAWFAVLRGPWCGLSLLELEQLVAIDGTPWTAIRELARFGGAPFSASTQQKLMHIHNCFLAAYEQRHRRSWSENLYQTMLALGMPGAFEHEISVQVVEVFFELLNRVDTLADVPDFAQLEKKLKELFVPPDMAAADVRTVQIMSMHKSKGLEFDVVFLPQLQRKSRADDKPLILIDKQTSLTSPKQELFVAPLDLNRSENSNSVFDYLWELNRQRSRNEACRLLYVAGTRAKSRLFLTGVLSESTEGELKKPDPTSLLALLWPQIDSLEGVKLHPVDALQKSEAIRFFRVPDANFLAGLGDRKKPAETEPDFAMPSGVVTTDDSESAYRRHAGTLIHWLLEQWAKAGRATETGNQGQQLYWKRELLRMGVPENQLQPAVHLVSQALVGLHHSAQAQWLLNQQHEQSHAELPVTYVDEHQQIQHLVIDRTFIDNGTRYIIDYKLSQPKSENESDIACFLQHQGLQYQSQLRVYKDALNAIEPMATKTCLYFPLIDQLHEVIC